MSFYFEPKEVSPSTCAPVLAENGLEVSDSTNVRMCLSSPNAANTVKHFLSGEIWRHVNLLGRNSESQMAPEEKCPHCGKCFRVF